MTGNLLFDRILMALTIIVSLGTVGSFVYTTMLYEKPLPTDAEEFARLQSDTAKAMSTETFQLEKLIINLHSRTKRLRFLDVTIHLVPFFDDQIKVMEENIPIINDTIINVAGEMKAEELNTISGKLFLEDRVKRTINTKLGKPIIKEMLFSRFVIQ